MSLSIVTGEGLIKGEFNWLKLLIVVGKSVANLFRLALQYYKVLIMVCVEGDNLNPNPIYMFVSTQI